MAERAYFKVVNFDRFQHYKDRSPPWIKLYNELLDNYEFACLQDASKAHLITLWLLASRSNNHLPYDPKWVQSRISANCEVDLDELLNAGFIELEQDCSETLAECKQTAIPEREGEGETEVEERSAKGAPCGASIDGLDPDQVVVPGSEDHKKEIYRLARRLGRPSAPTEMTKLGMTLNAIETTLRECESAAEPRSYLAKVIENKRRPQAPNPLSNIEEIVDGHSRTH